MLKFYGPLSLSLLFACSPAAPAPQPPAQPAPVPNSEPLPAVGGGSAQDPGGSSAGATTEKMCGGIAGIQCPEKQFCSFAPEARCGAGDMSGTCAPKPDACIQLLDEVCGCDDKTYGNACMASQAGVSVAMKGPCARPAEPTALEGKLCGTRGSPQQCAPGLYCAFKADCGQTDAGGICTKQPTVCTRIYAPVCGCDGKTYGSACTAAAAGASVAQKGECKK